MTWLAELLGLQAPQPKAQTRRTDFLVPTLGELLVADMPSRKGHEWDKDQRDPWRPTDSDREELWRQSVRSMQTAGLITEEMARQMQEQGLGQI